MVKVPTCDICLRDTVFYPWKWGVDKWSKYPSCAPLGGDSLICSPLQDLIATADRQSFTSPRYPRAPPPDGTICEYRIQAEDPSQRVKLILYRFKVYEPSYFRINLSGDKLFSESTVFREVSPASVPYYISEGDVMRIFFYGEANTNGFKLRYKMVP
ncbi:uncharacterized protein LOC122254263 [Penaeus japonicus]|uniref:uncharacterized protein LOC122254263 n=1 Tax=Penaeus japonicus TaxID=27405 RepID=UPI001C70B491|nr:uncharacterized protein LOC122254263 [Penaeus japonicus]